MKALKSAFSICTVRCVGCLPLGAARALGRMLGRLAWFCRSRARRMTELNLARCFPDMDEKERQQLARRSLLETGMLAAETCVLYTSRPGWAYRYIVEVHNDEIIRAYLNSGRGVILAAPHLGNWEVLGWQLVKLGPTTNMYMPPKLPAVDRLVRKSREMAGFNLVSVDRKGLYSVLKALKSGEIGGILPDQTPKDDSAGCYAPFFAAQAFTMTMLSKLTQSTGCAVVFGFAKRVPKGFDLYFEDAPDEIYDKDEATSVNALNKGVESLVKRAPEQYQWEYNRFRKQPQ